MGAGNLKKKVVGTASRDALRSALLNGCRVIELDLFESRKRMMKKKNGSLAATLSNSSSVATAVSTTEDEDDDGSEGGGEEEEEEEDEREAADIGDPQGFVTRIVVTHKNSGIVPVSLASCVKEIALNAFATSPYPLILTLENHVTPKHQPKIAAILKRRFGEALVEWEVREFFLGGGGGRY